MITVVPKSVKVAHAPHLTRRECCDVTAPDDTAPASLASARATTTAGIIARLAPDVQQDQVRLNYLAIRTNNLSDRDEKEGARRSLSWGAARESMPSSES